MNQSVEYSFTTPEFSIYQILLYGKENEYDMPVRIESLKNTSRYAKRAPGIVYRNENVWLGSSRLKYISVRFRVNNSWIKYNDLDNSRLFYLLKWNGTAWLVLRTNMIDKDVTYTYFEAQKAGNSRIGIFAISAPIRKTNTTDVVTIEKDENVVPVIEEIEDKSPNRLSGFYIIITIVGTILSYIYICKKR